MELNLDLLIAKVTEVAAIDTELDKAKGTAAERKAKALEQVKAADAEFVATTDGNVESMFARVERLSAELDEARQAIQDKVDEAVKAMSGKSDVVEGLKTHRAELVTQVDALAKLLPSFGVDISAVKLPSKSAPKVSGSSGVKSSGSRHYIIVDGERKFYSNTSFSYLAFALKMTNGGSGAEGLDKAIKDSGVTERTTDWETSIVVPDGPRKGETVTVGMVVDAPATAS